MSTMLLFLPVAPAATAAHAMHHADVCCLLSLRHDAAADIAAAMPLMPRAVIFARRDAPLHRR